MKHSIYRTQLFFSLASGIAFTAYISLEMYSVSTSSPVITSSFLEDFREGSLGLDFFGDYFGGYAAAGA